MIRLLYRNSVRGPSEDVRAFSIIEHLILRTSFFDHFLNPSPLTKSPAYADRSGGDNIMADRSEGYMLIGVRDIC